VIVTDQTGFRFPTYAPVTRRSDTVYKELIQAEFFAAEVLDLRQPELVTTTPAAYQSVPPGSPARGCAAPPPRTAGELHPRHPRIPRRHTRHHRIRHVHVVTMTCMPDNWL
jgi:hypothetical protein